jgi:uncharacterized protein (TIGR03032 family)
MGKSVVKAKQARERKKSNGVIDALWAHHHAELRDPHQIVSQWKEASEVDPRLLEYRVRGRWWDILDEAGVTLLVTREYEHLAMGLCVHGGRRRVSYLHLAHPNGLAIDRQQNVIHIASTRNPNMVYDFAPCADFLAEEKEKKAPCLEGLLLPLRVRYLPGSLYLHDLAVIDGGLYANAVGMNAVVNLPERSGFKPVWWPLCIESESGPRFNKNYLQLNSIAGGASIAESYFTASAAIPSGRRPGHLNFPVDRRGVVFSGKTREVVGTGLTRPHSARLRSGEVWVDNSGYGEFGRIRGGRFEVVWKLKGWTRGLCFHGNIAFVGTSRVIPRFRHYAPGIDCEQSECGVHALDMWSGKVLGSITWPTGNQLFAIEAIDRSVTLGFPFVQGGTGKAKKTYLFARGLTHSQG